MRASSREVGEALEHVRQRLYRLLESGVPGLVAAPGERQWSPPAEIRATEDEVILEMEISGVERDALEVELRGSTLTISGVRQHPAQHAGKRFHQAERPVGHFSRSFTVPGEMDADSAQAKLEDGVLTVRARWQPGGEA